MTMWSALRVPGVSAAARRGGTRAIRRHVWVLSGGGARGAAQAGAMAALLAGGIEPVGLAGCSVGALNAAFLAADPTAARAEDLAERWTRLGRGDVFGGSRLSTLRNIMARRDALFSAVPLRRLVETWLPVATFEELATPLRVVTTSLTSGRPVYHRSGALAEVLIASAALPGLFPPVLLPVLGDCGPVELHVDGGITDVVPVAGALDLMPTDLWVLDVASAPASGDSRARSALGVLVASLSTSMRPRPLPTLDGVVVHHLVMRDGADGRGGLMDFSRAAELVDLGRRTATRMVAQLERSTAEARQRSPQS